MTKLNNAQCACQFLTILENDNPCQEFWVGLKILTLNCCVKKKKLLLTLPAAVDAGGRDRSPGGGRSRHGIGGLGRRPHPLSHWGVRPRHVLVHRRLFVHVAAILLLGSGVV